MSSSGTHTVILGSGIIGLCTAFYLTESGHTNPEHIHLVDSSPELFCCASGLAGGYLAKDCTFSRDASGGGGGAAAAPGIRLDVCASELKTR